MHTMLLEPLASGHLRSAFVPGHVPYPPTENNSLVQTDSHHKPHPPHCKRWFFSIYANINEQDKMNSSIAEQTRS